MKLNNSFFNKHKKRALIAGCGTGLQIYNLARSVDDITLDAFDLSLKSLAYAKRAINELEIQDIAFLQGDILAIEKKTDDAKQKYIEALQRSENDTQKNFINLKISNLTK